MLDKYWLLIHNLNMYNMEKYGQLLSGYQKLKDKLETAIREAPEGSLYYRKNANGILLPYYSRYGREKREHRRIGLEDDEMIRTLQRKRFARQVLPKVNDCLKKLQTIEAVEEIDLYKEAALLGEEFRNCADWAAGILRPVNPAFEALKDRQNPYPFEKGFVDTKLGRFRSKNEALDAKILHESGIRFKYEPAVILGNKVLYPDFAVDLYWIQMIGIIERDGMLEDPQYRARKLNDLNRWISYGYYPGINLLILSDHPLCGYDEIRTEKLLRAFCLP